MVLAMMRLSFSGIYAHTNVCPCPVECGNIGRGFGDKLSLTGMGGEEPDCCRAAGDKQ